MNPLMLFKIVVVSTCLVASFANASPFSRQARSLQQAQSQLEARSVAAPAELSSAKAAAQQAKLHYVEIDPSLKGNYKFGYDTGSGPAGQSFREETRLDDGTVKGAYGYVDANGKQRIVKYTAGKAGFVVEGDQEAAGQQGQAQAQAEAPAQQAEPQRRPQPVNLPRQQQQQQPSQPTFDEPQPQQFTRTAAAAAAPAAEDRARAEQQHAEQLRQHQLATQAALAQQQRLAQQLQLQQQQIIAAQRQAPAQQQPQPQQQQQQQPNQQHQFAQHFPQQQQQHQQQQPQFHQQPHHHHAHIVDPQSGSFFSSSNDANLDQLLKSQLAQLQGARGGVPEQFLSAHQRPGAQTGAPAFHQAAAQQAPDFSQFRAARQAPQSAHFAHQHQHQHQAALTPQSALVALQQQQAQDAQMLAQLRAQQLARLQEQARQSPQTQLQQQEQAAHFRAQPQAQAFASQSQPLPVHQRAPAPEQFASQPSGQVAPASASAPVAVQPENFGPPVIDIRTLNYSIGQQTRV